jgi:signal transduction histidine kinase
MFLSDTTLWSKEYDGRRVSIKARLVNIDTDRADQILELQVGSRRFICRLETSHGAMPWLAPDSTLKVTGVYRAQGGGTLPGSEVNSFELLLNSPADVQVLARPSWWTLRHTLTILGVVIPIVLVAFVWIMILRRQVEKRTRELAVEIKRREQTDRQRVIEGERSRIARDLHDALGAALTQIRFLSIRGSRAPEMPEKSRAQLVRISEKSFEMVSSLDEIVWAVNPANDSLDKLVPYLCHIAEDFFSNSPIRCRLDVDENFPYAPLTSEVRHDLYLAVREVLNNTAKHSRATEVWFRIHWQNHAIRITIEDNGRGFLPPDPPNGDGLANVRHRLEKIGGCFQFETQLGSGTICRLWLPVEREPEQPAIIPE